MKKIFPVIIVLISLSLVGIILIQINWFKNQLFVQQERFIEKVEKAGFDVVQELSKQAAASNSFRLNKRQGLQLFPDNLSFKIGRLPTISDRYTTAEINDKLVKSFNKEGLTNLRFEFAITSSSDDFELEMQTEHFQQESFDTTHFRRIVIPIIPETGTDLEGLLAYEHLFIIIPDFKVQVWQSLTWMIVFSALFTVIIIAAFYITVRTMLNQKKMSEIKSDFINNMTHEFKTPLATISLAVDALKNEKVLNDKSKWQYFNNIIKDENRRMNKHVETILQAALMEKQELKLNLTHIHVHDLLRRVVDNFQLQMQEKNGTVDFLLNAADDTLDVDEVHFSNLVSNLIDNAIKYSKENLVIKIITHATPKHFVLQIQDNGIGMSKETVKHVFEKFYRAHTGNLHNVKGFGLGMSYAKTVIDAHKGKIKVESAPGKGSTFTLEFPHSLAEA
ncbi:MAG TPA: HAMP domain-containing sensor histidine kinase [Parafilimonas sp.]|nr:HAMP domain-containing sensor histidine kinase [Parafilimonas sp.]